jgi:hypothetical protein
MTEKLQIERRTSLRSLPKRHWDRVAGRYSAYGCHGWMLAVENMPGALDTAYYLAFRGGQPAGAFAAYLVDDKASPSYHPALAVRGEPASGEELFPAVLLGGRAGYTSEVMLRVPADGRDEFWARFADEVDSLVHEWGARSTWLLYGRSSSAEATQRAIGGSVYEMMPVTIVDLPPGGTAAWLSALRGHRRRRVQQEMRAFGRAGYQVQISPLGADDAPAFGDLLANTLRKYRGAASSAAMRSYVRLQAETMNRASVAFRCYLGGALVAFSYGFEWNGSLYMRACGFDYERLRQTYEYFNLVYYYPIRVAYERRLQKVEFGPASYEAKLLRGARLESRYAVGRHPGSAPEWAELSRRHVISAVGASVAGHADGGAGPGVPARPDPLSGQARP